MKHLNNYIQENLISNNDIIIESNNGTIIVEGFWSKLAKLFGFGTERVKQNMKDWKKELRDAFIAAQIAAAKLKDAKTTESIKKQDAAAEKSTKDLLNETKLEVQRLMKTWDNIKLVDYSFAQYKQLTLLSEQENDEEGKKLSEKFKKLIDDKFPDGGKNYEQTVEKIEKSGVNKTEEEQTNNQEAPKPEEAAKETIEEQTNVLEPLYKTLGDKVKADNLTKIVTDLIEKSGYLNGYKTKSGDIKTPSEESINANILGMSVIVCGALMMSSGKALKSVAEYLTNNNDKITNALKVKQLNLS